ncbi:MAG TPA: VCBS repeat-containing protein [Bryobacteraceae bacterium]|nr:VCBS repeat-containing protein [Bryobacteraceae bacterium]
MLFKNWKLWGAAILILSAPGNLFPLTPISFDAPRAYPIGSTFYPGSPTSVAVADLNGDGHLDAVVTGFGGYSERGYVSVLLGKAGGGLLAQTQLDTGAISASGVVIADVNGDGKPDLVIASAVIVGESVQAAVSIMLGNGDGTFQAPVNYDAAAGGSAGSIAVGDFNGDGKPDIAMTSGVNSVSILLGNGDGTFQPAVAYAAGAGKSPQYLAVGDFNLDGNLDLVFVTSASAYVTILLGNGDGTFRAPVNYPALEYPGSVAVADFNGDGKPDLAVSTLGLNSGPDFVRILLGNGDGTFQKPAICAAGYGPVAVTVGDFNGDGKLDLAVGNRGPFMTGEGAIGDTISIALGNGDGTFQPPISYTAGSQPVALALGDFNGDGVLDIAVADVYTTYLAVNGGNLAILLGNPLGAVQHTATYPVAPLDGQLTSMAAGDFNGDGKPDLALTDYYNSTVTILLTDSLKQSIYPVGPQPGSVAVGDFNRDGKLDLAVANYGGSTVSILLGNGDGTFQPQATYLVGQGTSLAIGDFNGDGNLDLAVVLYPDNVSILLGNGDGAFQPPVYYVLPNASLGLSSVAVGDLNGDGNLDLVVDTSASSGCCIARWILLGNGDGTFQPATYTAGGPGGYLALADVNGDGILDLVTGQGVFLGNGNATFQKLLQFPGFDFGGPFPSFAITDFNGDGRLDVAVLAEGMVGLLLGNGDGTFQWEASFVAGIPQFSIIPAIPPNLIVAADFNADGLPDVAVASGLRNARTVTLLTNTGP